MEPDWLLDVKASPSSYKFVSCNGWMGQRYSFILQRLLSPPTELESLLYNMCTISCYKTCKRSGSSTVSTPRIGGVEPPIWWCHLDIHNQSHCTGFQLDNFLLKSQKNCQQDYFEMLFWTMFYISGFHWSHKVVAAYDSKNQGKETCWGTGPRDILL